MSFKDYLCNGGFDNLINSIFIIEVILEISLDLIVLLMTNWPRIPLIIKIYHGDRDIVACYCLFKLGGQRGFAGPINT